MFWLSIVALSSLISHGHSITCYECTSGSGVDCKWAPKSCAFGLFGCVKIAVYSGGVDRMGQVNNDESRIVSMVRGCSIIPFGNVDMCEQSAIVGFRIIKCTCFNDYCNSGHYSSLSFPILIALIAYLIL